ncbi:hypothetical protein Cni_G14650 [Canna indica]|uniref:Uncharacterized protein n=1 Tax=Canna indica TaxID=4628 RepID=A0AAQ3KC30_9LILI|nr:hypothetical protein Cni_G14650 [Canna indica]
MRVKSNPPNSCNDFSSKKDRLERSVLFTCCKLQRYGANFYSRSRKEKDSFGIAGYACGGMSSHAPLMEDEEEWEKAVSPRTDIHVRL